MIPPNTLVWEDTFSGRLLDRSKWECEVNAFGGGNHEEQIYTDRPANVRVEDGHLIIEAHKDNPNIQGTIRPWSSGRIRSKYRGDWKHGLFEARMRIPKGQGFWPAFWLLPTDEIHGPWPLSGEIDIMENTGHLPNQVGVAVHYGQPWPNNRFTAQVPAYTIPADQPDFTQDFHRFGLHWRPHKLMWTVDGALVFSVTMDDIQRDGGNPAAFQERFHIVMNLAVGGNLPGNTDATTPSPARMEVDWVRVYQ